MGLPRRESKQVPAICGLQCAMPACPTVSPTVCPTVCPTACHQAACPCPPHPTPPAPADGRPFISLRVFDWDLVSADDFLGQCEVPFADLDPRQQGPSQPTWLPLYGVGRGGKREDAGEVQVAIWFQAGGGAEGQDGEAVSGRAGNMAAAGWADGGSHQSAAVRGAPVRSRPGLSRPRILTDVASWPPLLQATARPARCAARPAPASMCRRWCTATRACSMRSP